ncbi:MAG: hypothetical protein U0610_31655, partial [bacterium]
MTDAPVTRPLRRIDADEVIATAERLAQRIRERFPDSGLARVARELHAISVEAKERAVWLRAPNWLMRGVATLLVTLLLVIVIATLARIGLPRRIETFQELVQVLESGINDVVFVGIAVFFVTSLETRRKRKRALDWIDELRSLAHIVDMHQLTKDPDQFRRDRVATPSSPTRSLTRAELTRYLDYSSELLAVTSKVAALYAQDFGDAGLLAAVNEIENLTSGLARKIWQKLMVL